MASHNVNIVLRSDKTGSGFADTLKDIPQGRVPMNLQGVSPTLKGRVPTLHRECPQRRGTVPGEKCG